VEKAIKNVKDVFPFDNYITEGKQREVHTILAEISKFLKELQGKRLLDIGCGPMDKTGIFQMMGFQCYAVDDLTDPWHQRGDNIKKIKEYAEKINIVFNHQKAGQYTIPFATSSFDVVCSISLIEHLHESPRDLLNSMGVFARPGGLIVIVMPNSVNLKKRLSVLLGRTNYPPVDMFYHSNGTWRGHVREYTLKETIYVCKETGFELLSGVTFEAIAYEKLECPLRQLYLLSGKLIPTLRSNLLVICRKPQNWVPVKNNPEAFRKATARAVPKGVA